MIKDCLPLAVLVISLWVKAGCQVSTATASEELALGILLVGWTVIAAMCSWVSQARYSGTGVRSPKAYVERIRPLDASQEARVLAGIDRVCHRVGRMLATQWFLGGRFCGAQAEHEILWEASGALVDGVVEVPGGHVVDRREVLP